MKIFRLTIPKYTFNSFFSELISVLSWKQDASNWKTVFTPNPEICLHSLRDREFEKLLQQSDYLTSDGIGLYIAYQIQDSYLPRFLRFLSIPYYICNILFRKKYLYQKYGERICGSDLTEKLLIYAQENKIKICILDLYNPTDLGKVESQKVFHLKLKKAFPKLDFDVYIYKPDDKEEIFSSIRWSWAKILFSTLGMKKQEKSVFEALDSCSNLRLWLGIWSSFDYFIGYQKRAPEYIRNIWFEWLYRIFTSPNKLNRLKRIYMALIVFPIKVLLFPVDK